MISEASDVVEFSDISLNSEIETIRDLSGEAVKRNKIHKIILMIDVGDIREGIFNEDEIEQMVKNIIKLTNTKLIGIGTNLTCFGGVDPSKDNLGKLVRIKKQIEKKFGIWLEVLSGGSSGSIPIMQRGDMPIEINQLRIGSAISIGNGLHGVKLEGTYNDCFILKAEIIEIKMKPSVPIGNRGTNAFGRIVKFEDRGIIKRAICALGKQDIDEEYIILLDDKI